MDFLAIFNEHYVEVVVIGCICLGFILKRWVKDVENKYIPTILAVTGAVLNIWKSGMSLDSVVYGVFMGVTATGLHQMFKAFIERGSEGVHE